MVDETIKNIQTYNQRLYTNESGIGEQIHDRVEGLRHVANSESYYDLQQSYDMDEFENAGYEELMNDEFDPEV